MPTSHTQSAERRFYAVSRHMDPRSAGFDFPELDDALIGGRRLGRHERWIPGHPHPTFVGVPEFRKKPRVVVFGTGRSALDYYDFGTIFVSSRARELLAALDPGAFEFAECDTVDRKGNPVEPYWWMSVIRWATAFDEERSTFTWYRDRFPREGKDNPSLYDLHELRMPADFPAEHHAFHLAFYPGRFIFDGAMVDAWRDRGFTGATFTPLQPPTKAEMKDHLRFLNYPFWTERMRDA